MIDAEKLLDDLEQLKEACEVIRSADGCDKCPLYEGCLDVNILSDVIEGTSVDEINDLLAFADDIENPITDADIDAYYADMARKAERDEYYD